MSSGPPGVARESYEERSTGAASGMRSSSRRAGGGCFRLLSFFADFPVDFFATFLATAHPFRSVLPRVLRICAVRDRWWNGGRDARRYGYRYERQGPVTAKVVPGR